jgi:predicted GH43/DUF377 family glycosyl hydrolase
MFQIENDIPLRVHATEPLLSMYTLSPYVWQSDDRFQVLIRAVNRDDDPAKKVARVYHGWSDDGLTFQMDPSPDLNPGPGEDDCDGCEDPSIALDGGCIWVYYTGWNQRKGEGKLLLASGPDACHLHKDGVALDSTPTHQNPKEATIARCPDGTWRLFFEYARAGRSRIGLAHSKHVNGPWQIDADPMVARDAGWDSWHLSPGPVMPHEGNVVMFYNGADDKAAWRIGWAVFDPSFSTLIERSNDPLIVPPRPVGDDTDIAFAASAVARARRTWLYYSIADKTMQRATVQP